MNSRFLGRDNIFVWKKMLLTFYDVFDVLIMLLVLFLC